MDELLKIASGALPGFMGLAVRYGVPAIIEGIQVLNKETITEADLADLEGLVMKPEDYRHHK